MITNPFYGWCSFTLGSVRNFLVQKTDVPMELLNMFIDYRSMGFGIATLVGENDTVCITVSKEHGFQMFSEKEQDVTPLDANIDRYEQSLLRDISFALEDWARWYSDGSVQDAINRRRLLKQKMHCLESIKH